MRQIFAATAAAFLAGCMAPGTAEVSRAAPSTETRTVAVLSNQPQDLRLCDEDCREIQTFPGLTWEQTGRGYETTIRFSTALIEGRREVTLMRRDDRGWSTWGRSELDHLRHKDVTQAEPACVGGEAWCATRGL